jgi:hypothetical protein
MLFLFDPFSVAALFNVRKKSVLWLTVRTTYNTRSEFLMGLHSLFLSKHPQLPSQVISREKLFKSRGGCGGEF